MARAATVVVEMTAETARLIKGIDVSRAKLTTLKNTTYKADAALKNYIKTAIGVYGVAKAFSAAESAASSFVATASEFERFETILTSIEGSSESASRSMEWVSDFATRTPYEVDQVTEAFVKAKAYGIDPTAGSLIALGDASAAMGKDLMQAVEAIADAMTGENERLKEFGIKAKVTGDQITYNWTDSSGKMRAVTVENNRAIIESTLSAIFNEKYAGAMDRLSHTWVGMISNLNDSWTKYQKAVMDAGVFEYIKAVLGEVKAEIGEAFDASTPEEWAKVITDAMDASIKSAGVLRDALRFIEIGAGFISAAFWEFVYSIDVAMNSMIKAYNYITDSNVALYDTAKAWEKVEKARAGYMEQIKLSNDGAGQKWAEQTIADLHKEAAATSASTEESKKRKEAADELLSSLGAQKDAIEDVYSAEVKASDATIDYYQAELDAVAAIENEADAHADAVSNIQAHTDAVRDAADAQAEYVSIVNSTPSSMYDENGNIINQTRTGSGGGGSLTNEQVMDMNYFSPQTGMRWDVYGAQNDIREQQAADTYAKLLEEKQRADEQAAIAEQKAAEELQRRAEEAQAELDRRREEEEKAVEEALREQEEAIREYTDELKAAQSELQGISDGLGTDWVEQAREALYGDTDAAKQLDEYFALASEAWDAFAEDTTNEELLDAYNNRMTELIGEVSDLNDTTKFESKAQQDWAKAQALYQISGYQDAQLETKDEIDAQLAVLNDILDVNTEHKSVSELIEDYTSATKSYSSSIKSYTGETADKSQSLEKGYHEEWVDTGGYFATIKETTYTLGVDGDLFESGRTESQVYKPKYEKVKFYQQVAQFQTGGYTGDLPVDAFAGIVHGQEYVVNAETTRDLGLNGSQGLFQKMIDELKAVKEENRAMRALLMDVASASGQIAYSERLRNYADGIEEVA